MKYHKPTNRTVDEVKAAADKNWAYAYTEALNGKLDNTLICKAIDWCNQLDEHEHQKQLSNYLQKRKNWLVDPDSPSDDEELEKNYQRLRQQYQALYGKDPKYG